MRCLAKIIFLAAAVYLTSIQAQENISFCKAESNSLSRKLPVKQKEINIPAQPVISIGVSETRDVAALFFKMYESYLKASEDGEVNFTDLQYLLGPAMLLIPAFSGASNIVYELASLTDDQVKALLLIADEYELGNHAQRAKQVFKTLLTLAQTYFVFEAAR